MRISIAPIALAAVIAAAPLAFAAQSSTGLIKAFDAKMHSVTLQDGTTYKLPANFKDPGLKAGQKIQVNWNKNGADHEASSVKIVK
ncbi:MAG: DUF1344 domain-containing protein [Mesorhizobium sp.]